MCFNMFISISEVNESRESKHGDHKGSHSRVTCMEMTLENLQKNCKVCNMVKIRKNEHNNDTHDTDHECNKQC